MGSATFPWDLLKAESLRSVCRDVGLQGRTRDVMINFLKSVETLGLKDALSQHIEDTRATSVKSASTTAPSTPLTPKRIREPVVSDYNTRHRDKRVRLSDPGPGAKRVRVVKKAGTKQPQTSAAASSRGLGELKSAMKKPPSVKAARKEVFDGVLLRRLTAAEGKSRAEDNEEGADITTSELNGSTSDGHDELPGEENGLPFRDESSLADSNKENELMVDSSNADDELDQSEHDDPNNTEGSSQPIHGDLHDRTATTAESFEDDLDAEGEVIAEHEDADPELATEGRVPEREQEITITVLQDNASVLRDMEVVTNGEIESGEVTPVEAPIGQAYQHPDIGDLTTQDVNEIERLLISVVESQQIT